MHPDKQLSVCLKIPIFRDCTSFRTVVSLRRQIKEKRMTKAGTKKSIIFLCLQALFISYPASITFFVHTHTINGQTITHSHPYQGTPDNQGHEPVFFLFNN